MLRLGFRKTRKSAPREKKAGGESTDIVRTLIFGEIGENEAVWAGAPRAWHA